MVTINYGYNLCNLQSAIYRIYTSDKSQRAAGFLLPIMMMIMMMMMMMMMMISVNLCKVVAGVHPANQQTMHLIKEIIQGYYKATKISAI